MKTLSYEETIDVMRQYGRKMYKFFYEADELFAGQNTKEVLKKLEANPFVEEYQLLDKQAKADYMNDKFKPFFKGECL